ncbi:DNA repair protein RecN [Candidatus Deferrimicrobium sp.]|uniref:DNA repair protein RecN n=1 Tax=Candidatus Deferrimicrobium sp. TaxID=3060586 RepID=UPI002ED83F50
MLIELTVRNLAIFEDVRVPFSAGLNVVTGETGAGKSLLVEAIRLALGEKADPVAVRTGETEAEVIALFDLSRRDDLRDAWEEAGLPWEEEVVLRRVLPAAGRSRAYLNGRPVAQPVLAVLSPLLLTMVGQHSVPQLLSRAAALTAVDDFAGAGTLSSGMRKRYRRVAALRRQAAEAADRGAGARSRTETLDFEIGELSKAALAPGEEEELGADLSLLRNAAKVREALQAADDALASSESAALVSMAFALARLREAAAVDPRLAETAERLRSAREEVQDLSRELGSLAARVMEDPERRERVEERLSVIRRLKRKYGKEVPELVSHLDLLRSDRESLSGALEEEARLRKELLNEEEDGVAAAKKLSGTRRKAAAAMGPAVEKELSRVALAGARFRAEVSSREAVPAALSASGIDEAELLFSANPGQELRPLSQTASGGELSRVMLSLRNAASRGGAGKTLVFDEIDTGIGGQVAERVGARLKSLSVAAQVVCVTHLPQVAAFADHHLQVVKKTAAGAVATGVKPLSKQDRIGELARMISGAEITEKAKAHAKTLIEKAAGE